MPDFTADPGFISTDQGTIFDLEASRGELFGAGLEEALDYNPLPIIGRQARFLSEDFAILAGEGDLVDQKDAEEEVKRRGLDLKIPVGGISRVELDMLQYLKQREVTRSATFQRPRPIGGTAAAFAGGLVGSAVDPVNVASAFVPVVGEARYAAWLANAGTNTLARVGVRAGAGAIEGAVGAAIIEPISYLGADAEQREYGLQDSLVNVMFGSVLGGGLHIAGGAVYDYRGARAARGIDALVGRLAREDAAAAPEGVHLDALQSATRSLEDDTRVTAASAFENARPADRVPAPEMPEGTLARELQDATIEAKVAEAVEAARVEAKAQGQEVGDFGPIHRGLSYEEGVKRLAKDQDGDLPGALTHPEVGPIDVVWGRAGEKVSDGYGLAKIVKFHPEVVDDLPAIVAGLPVVSRSENRIKLADANARAMVRLDYDGKSKTWLLTAFGTKGDEAALRSADDGPADPRGGADNLPPTQGPGNVRPDASKINEPPEDTATVKAAETAVTAREATPEDVAADTEGFALHLESMRERGLVTEQMEAEIKAADTVAAKLEEEAKAYEAAAMCDIEGPL